MAQQAFEISRGDWVTGCCGVVVAEQITHAAGCKLAGVTQQLRYVGEWVCASCEAPMIAPDGDGAPVMTHDIHCTQLPAGAEA